MSYDQFVNLLFNPDEYVCAGSTYTNTLIPVSELDMFREYVALNPFQADTSRRKSNISALRNLLIECDDPSLSIDAQIALMKSLNVPYSTATYSAGKSVHFVLCLTESLPDAAAYTLLHKRIQRVIRQMDPKVKDPGRFTRNPGHFNEQRGKEQSLLYTGERIPFEKVNRWLNDAGITAESVKAPVIQAPKVLKRGMKGVLNQRARVFLRCGAKSGEWNNSLFFAACEAARCRYSQDEFVELAKKITGVLDESDITTINSAYSTIVIEGQLPIESEQ